MAYRERLQWSVLAVWARENDKLIFHKPALVQLT